MPNGDFGFCAFSADSAGHSALIQRDICQSVRIGIQFAADVLDDEVLNLPGQFRGTFVQRFQVRAFHFVTALHLPHEKFGITSNSKRVNVVACCVIKRGEKRVILGNIICFAADILRQLENDFSGSISQDHGVRRRTGIPARSTVDISDVNARRRTRRRSVCE